MRRLVWFASLAALLASSVVLGSQAPAATIVKRTVLPDGTVELQYSDGTTKRVTGDRAKPSDQGETQNAVGPEGADPIIPVAPPVWLDDPATKKMFLEAMAEYYRYRTSGLQHRRRVFEWQLASSKIIFVAVLLLVASGITFAALQFRAGLKRITAGVPEAVTEVALSTTSVKVSSPVLGVIILVISLAFFYLYLVYVYPISELV
jgi:hypothetical protein